MTPFQRISVSETKEKLKTISEIAIIDIRDPATFVDGHIEGAINLQNDEIFEFAETTDKTMPILVYCYRGISCQRIAQYLVEQNFSEVYSLDGGYEAWHSEKE